MDRLRAVVAAVEKRPFLVVGALVAVVAAAAAYFTTQMTSFEPDELGYTRIAITMGDTMRPIALDALGRDRLNQLYPLTIAPYYAVWDNVVAYKAAHVWNAILMASTAIPGYLLAGRVLTRRWGAYLAAALVVAVPWMTLSAVQLTEVAAYPASVWAFLGMHRAVSEPSPGRDAIAILGIGVAAFARLQLIVLLPLFVVAVLWQEIAAVARAPRVGRRRLLRKALREHRLLVVVAVLGLLVGVPLLASGALAEKFGFYGNTLSGKVFPAGMGGSAVDNAAALAVGLGVVPAAFAVGGWLEAIAGSRDRRVHGFAVLGLVVSVGVLLQVANINVRFTGSVVQERYVMFLGPLLVIGLLVAVERSRRLPAAVLAGTIVVAVVVALCNYQSQRTAFWYLVSPGVTTFLDVIGPALGRAGGWLGWPDASRYLLMAILASAVSVGGALVLMQLERGSALAVAGLLTLAFCAVTTAHAFVRVIHSGIGGAGLGEGSTANADWIDRALPNGASASLVARQLGGVADARQRWWTTEFWNRSINGAYVFGQPQYTYNSPREIRVDTVDGQLQTDAARAPYIVTSASGVPVGIAGRQVAASPDRDMVMLHAPGPMRARWIVSDISDDGWFKLTRPAVLRTYSSGCSTLTLTLAAPAGLPAPRIVRIVDRAGVRTSRVPVGGKLLTRVSACDQRPVLVSVLPGRDATDTAATVRLVSVQAFEA